MEFAPEVDALIRARYTPRQYNNLKASLTHAINTMHHLRDHIPEVFEMVRQQAAAEIRRVPVPIDHDVRTALAVLIDEIQASVGREQTVTPSPRPLPHVPRQPLRLVAPARAEPRALADGTNG